MATSGTTTYQLTRNQILDAAISTLGVLARGQTPDSEDYDKAAVKLNMLLAKYRTKQLPLWKRTEYTFSLQDSVSSYTIGSGQMLSTTFPLKMLEAWAIPTGGNTPVSIELVANSEYNQLPTNTSSGMPLKMTYQPLVNRGVMKIWPVPNSSAATAYTIKIVYQAPFEYFTSSSETMDLPEEYYLPLVYDLAVLIAPDWGLPLEDRRALREEAEKYMNEIQSFGEEDASWFFQVDRRR